jgi:hypothetical protein
MTNQHERASKLWNPHDAVESTDACDVGLNQSISQLHVSIFGVSLRTMAASHFRSLTRSPMGLDWEAGMTRAATGVPRNGERAERRVGPLL